jgi:hypothetical protein
VRKRTRIILIVLIAFIALGVVGITISLKRIDPRLHDWVTSLLGDSLESEIELGDVRLNWFPLRLHAKDLVVRHHGRRDIPPLIIVSSFTVDLKATDLWSSTVERVWVDGLEINIPPKDPNTGRRPFPKSPGEEPSEKGKRDSDPLVIRNMIATNTRLAIVPREAGKNAKVWDVFELDMKNLRSDEPATFTAGLINPIPYGKIETTGTFGPWSSEEPGDSQISGEYTFAADLGTINGLGGQLNASGAMNGTLDQISTRGETHTPDFRLTELDGASLPLDTSFEALVDGTKGDVELKRVDVQIGKSKMVARGLVEGTKGIKGKRVVVNLKSSSTDLGEMLRLVSKAARAPASGVLTLDTALDLPQGKAPILERLALEGSVKADRLKFSSDAVQDKIDELSRRGQGRPTDAAIDNVASKMATKFVLNKGVFTYRGLSFNVEGAQIRLDGTHSLRTKTVDFAGVVLLNATVSQTQTGYKSWLLKPFDPLFKKNGAGARLVITVAGTQDQPKVGLDFGKTIKGK